MCVVRCALCVVLCCFQSVLMAVSSANAEAWQEQIDLPEPADIAVSRQRGWRNGLPAAERGLPPFFWPAHDIRVCRKPCPTSMGATRLGLHPISFLPSPAGRTPRPSQARTARPAAPAGHNGGGAVGVASRVAERGPPRLLLRSGHNRVFPDGVPSEWPGTETCRSGPSLPLVWSFFCCSALWALLA